MAASRPFPPKPETGGSRRAATSRGSRNGNPEAEDERENENEGEEDFFRLRSCCGDYIGGMGWF